jgi:hypothetical protein
MLEVFPGLATYSPAIFIVLAIVGAINLTLIAPTGRTRKGCQTGIE